MRKNPWLRIGFDAWRLSFEAASVIGLRAMKLAAGGAPAATEARRMMAEKVVAAVALGAGLAPRSPHAAAAKTLRHYRRKVRANRRRLTKG